MNRQRCPSKGETQRRYATRRLTTTRAGAVIAASPRSACRARDRDRRRAAGSSWRPQQGWPSRRGVHRRAIGPGGHERGGEAGAARDCGPPPSRRIVIRRSRHASVRRERGGRQASAYRRGRRGVPLQRTRLGDAGGPPWAAPASVRPTGAGGPCRGAPTGSRVRRASASADENRGSSPDGGCSAEKSACSPENSRSGSDPGKLGSWHACAALIRAARPRYGGPPPGSNPGRVDRERRLVKATRRVRGALSGYVVENCLLAP